MRAVPFALALALLCAAPAQQAAATELRDPWAADYDVWLGGFRLAALRVEMAPAPEGWRARAEVTTKGLAAFFIPAQGAAEAAPGWFRARGDFDGLLQTVEMRHAAGAAPEIRAEPALRQRAYDAPPQTLRGALDPLTAAVAALSPRPAAQACGQRVEVFDSRRRFDLALGPGVREGGMLRCEGAYVRVAGFKDKHMRLPDSAFTLWWRVRDGVAEFEKAVAPTPLGHAVAKRRAA